MMKRSIVLLVLLISACFVKAQTKTFSGKVINAENGTPLSDATISLKGGKVTTKTNAEGVYEITIPEKKKPVIEVTYVGYEPQEVALVAAKMPDIALKTQQSSLDAVVVVG